MGNKSSVRLVSFGIVSLFLLGALCSCATVEPPSFNPQPTNEPVNEQGQGNDSDETPSAPTSEDSDTASTRTYTLDEIHNLSASFFIMRGDSFESAESCVVERAPAAEGNYFYPDEGADFGDAIPTLNLAEGDVLVTTSAKTEEEFYRPDSSGYFGDAAWEIYPERLETINGQDIPDDWEKLDDTTQEAFLASALSPLGITLEYGRYSGNRLPVATSPTTLPYGRFVGTQYEESVVDLNIPYYHVYLGFWGDDTDQSMIVCPVEETREGYFVVDTSRLETGTYFFCPSLGGRYVRLDVVR